MHLYLLISHLIVSFYIYSYRQHTAKISVDDDFFYIGKEMSSHSMQNLGLILLFLIFVSLPLCQMLILLLGYLNSDVFY